MNSSALGTIRLGSINLGHQITSFAGTEIIVPVASLSLTGFAPTAAQIGGNVFLTIPKADLTLTGFAPTITADVNVTVGFAQLLLTGFPPTVASFRPGGSPDCQLVHGRSTPTFLLIDREQDERKGT